MIFLKKYCFLFLLFFLPISVLADSARSSIVMDVDSGRILYSKNMHERRLIASITKIMTCIVVLENSHLDDEIEVGKEVNAMYGTNIYVQEGEVLTVRDLLYGLMLQSGNDAAIVLAHHIFSSFDEFILKMNEKAEEIGMKNTTFENPHGLDDDTKNYSTAYDMALLSRYAYQNLEYRKIISTKKYKTQSSFKSYSWNNRMKLLSSYKKCLGGKNGYTPRAGKTLVSLAKKDDVLLTIVSLNDGDLYQNHKNLYEKFFQRYQKYTILDKNTFSIDTSFVEGDFYIKKNFEYLFREDEIEKIRTIVELFPVTKGRVAGKVLIQFEENTIGEVPIYLKREQKKKDTNIFQKIRNLFIR